MKNYRKLKVLNEGDDEEVHISGDPHNAYHTLCGWVDVRVKYVDINTKVTCDRCISMLKYCHSINLKDLD
jgi:hypothetical protein